MCHKISRSVVVYEYGLIDESLRAKIRNNLGDSTAVSSDLDSHTRESYYEHGCIMDVSWTYHGRIMDVTWMYHGCIMDYLCKMYVEVCNVYVRSM